MFTDAGTLWSARNVAGSIGTTSAYPLAGTVLPGWKANGAPGIDELIPRRVHRRLVLAGSTSGTAWPVRLRSSMYSTPVPVGLYMISLITTGPTFGAALAAA